MKAFFGGVPTTIEVRKLDQAFGKPAPGTELSHAEVEEVIGVKRSTNRYRSVIVAWRSELFRAGVDLLAIPGIGFRSLTVTERIKQGVKGVQRGTRGTLRAITRANSVTTTDPVEQQVQAVMMKLATAVRSEANQMMRAIEPPKPSEQMMRAIPGGKR